MDSVLHDNSMYFLEKRKAKTCRKHESSIKKERKDIQHNNFKTYNYF